MAPKVHSGVQAEDSVPSGFLVCFLGGWQKEFLGKSFGNQETDIYCLISCPVQQNQTVRCLYVDMDMCVCMGICTYIHLTLLKCEKELSLLTQYFLTSVWSRLQSN